MALQRINVEADNLASLMLLERKADNSFSMFRNCSDFVLTSSISEYAKWLKDFVVPNGLIGSFVYYLPHGIRASEVFASDYLLAVSYLGDMAHAVAKDTYLAAERNEQPSLIEWSDFKPDMPEFNCYSVDTMTEASDMLSSRLQRFGYDVGKQVKRFPYIENWNVAVLAYATIFSSQYAWSRKISN